jgi:glycosyltransferase involved in cell wall biosynthesis
MRLLVVHPDNPQLPSAWSRAPVNLMNQLQSLGHEVFPVTCGRGSLLERIFFRLIQKIRGSDVTYSRIFRLYARWLLNRAEEKLKPDAIIHCASTAAIPRTHSKTRHYLYCDSTWHRYITLTPNLKQPSQKIITQVEALEKIAYSNLNHIFSFSTAVREDLIGYFGIPKDKVSVVGTGTGIVDVYNGPKSYSDGIILYVALRAPKQKGGELLLKAFEIAVKKNPALSLVMEGGSIPAEMATNIPNVKLLGKSSKDELQSLFNTASLFAMPALFEPWGNVYIEALASRTPVLGLNRNSLPDITSNGQFGFLVDEASPNAVAQAILTATSNPERLKTMGLAGQKFVLENYTWDRVAEVMTSRISSDSDCK